MLTADQIDALGDKAQRIVSPIVEYLLRDIAQRVAEAGQLTSTASYQVWRLQQLGVSQQQIRKKLEKLLKVSGLELKQLLRQSAEVGYDFDISRLPSVQAVSFKKNSVVQDIVSAAVQMAQDDLSNMVQTLGFVDRDGKVLSLTQAYQQACDFAFQKVTAGAQDYNSAIQEAVRGLTKKGIVTIDYESGTHTSLEAAVRRNVMSALGTMQEKISRQNHDDLGCDGWEISAHAASAPDHEPIQGKQYSDAEYTALNNSLVRRIGTLNCGHSAFPIILGVTSPQYSAEELEKMRRENEKGVTYEGKHYTTYEATQRQRQLERSIRKYKRSILVDEAIGDKEQLTGDQIRLVRLEDEYARFTKATKLRPQHERMNAAGFGPKQATAAEKIAERNFFTVARIGRSVGAKAKNYRVYDPQNDSFIQLAEGTRITQPKNHVMAGKGRERQIDCLDWLLDKYGGDEVQWTKEKGFGYIEDEYGEIHQVELHWYQEPSIGKVEMKLKYREGKVYLDEE